MCVFRWPWAAHLHPPSMDLSSNHEFPNPDPSLSIEIKTVEKYIKDFGVPPLKIMDWNMLPGVWYKFIIISQINETKLVEVIKVFIN